MKTFLKNFVLKSHMPTIYLFIFSILFINSATMPSYAISADQKKLFNKNIFYYDLACEGVQSGVSEASGDIKSVYMVGDSITLGAKDSYNLEKKFTDKGIDAHITASGGASLNHGGSTGSKKSGIQSVKDDGDIIKNTDAVVVAHGTNNYPSEFEGLLKDMIGEIKKQNSEASIFWANTNTDSSSGLTLNGEKAYTSSSSNKKNEIIARQSAALDFNVINLEAANIPLSSDGIHPAFRETGHGKWGDAVVEEVSKGKSASGPKSKSNEKIYMIGDSITVRAENKLNDEFTKRGANKITIDGSVNRSITKPGDTRGHTTSGLEAVRLGESAIKNADAVVIALGTNQRDSDFKQSMGDLVKAIKGDAKLYWVNVFSKGGSNGYAKLDKDKINQDISSQADSLNFDVIDTDKAGIPLADSVHQTTPAGSNKLSKLIADQVFEGGKETKEEQPNGNCACQPGNTTSNGTLSSSVPEPWKSVIEKGGQHPEAKEAKVDPNLVAAVLWIENRGWPDYNKEWAVSPAGAAGPWQFIDSTWGPPTNMGRDGDGDGVKDRTNPKDAVVSAYLHHAGSLNKPLANKGYDKSKDAEQNFQTVVLERNDNNLLSFAAKYNGRGAPDGAKLTDFPAGDENSDYVIMAYWLLATDFKFGYDPVAGKKVDAKSAGGSSASAGPAEGQACSSGTGTATGEFIWPLDKQYPVTTCYGFSRRDSSGNPRLHSGLDIGAPRGTDIVAADGGTVTFVGVSSGFGNTVVIKHKNGFSTLYAHQKDGSMVVQKGDKVDRGQKIGQVNNTGVSYGDHLHFNIQKNDQPAYARDGSDTEDPLKHLPKDGRGISGGDCP